MGSMLEADRKRVNASGERMVRAFSFLERGKPLLPNEQVRVAFNLGVDHRDPVIQHFALVYSRCCSDHRTGAVGTAFSYAVGIGNGCAVWLLMLYENVIWLATVQTDISVAQHLLSHELPC